MKEFSSILAFVEELAAIIIAEEKAARDAVSKCARLVQNRAKEKIGEYQAEAGPFPAWNALADSTLYGGVDEDGHRFPGKIELGYATETEHNPLLRTGAMRNSIGRYISPDGLEAQIGSASEIALYQEIGTSKIPPRSFLGGAMAEKLPEIKTIIAEETIGALIGREVVSAGLFGNTGLEQDIALKD